MTTRETLTCSCCGALLQLPSSGAEIRCSYCNGTTLLPARADLITAPEQARALLAAILDDIALWGAFDRRAPKEQREAELQKGRSLYQRRVASELHALFDEAASARKR
jgi:LSD1 subclass zinc finger protein